MLPSQEEWGPIIQLLKLIACEVVICERVFRHVDCKLNINGSVNCCVYFIEYMHNIVLSEQYGMPGGLNYESTHIQMSSILYFFKISKPLTLYNGQCGLEGIVIKLLPGI